MDLQELKTRLKISDDSQDESLELALEDAIDFAKTWCNNPFLNDEGELEIPSSVKKGIAMMVDIDRNTTNGIESESIAGMNQTFTNSNERYAPVFKLWRPYKKVRFI